MKQQIWSSSAFLNKMCLLLHFLALWLLSAPCQYLSSTKRQWYCKMILYEYNSIELNIFLEMNLASRYKTINLKFLKTQKDNLSYFGKHIVTFLGRGTIKEIALKISKINFSEVFCNPVKHSCLVATVGYCCLTQLCFSTLHFSRPKMSVVECKRRGRMFVKESRCIFLSE